MIDIIETNLALNNSDEIVDHQSRVIEATSWEDYIEEILSSKAISRHSKIGNLIRNSIPKNAEVMNIKYDEKHLSCDIKTITHHKIKHLAYKVN